MNIEDIKPGVKIKLRNGMEKKLLHIITIVEDDYVVFKWWARYKQRWIYEVEFSYYFQIRLNKMELVR